MTIALAFPKLLQSGRARGERSAYQSEIRTPLAMQQLVAAVLLLMSLPLLLIVALAIRCESRGQVLYTQTRVGLHGRRFKIYKFRSMLMPEDPRYPSAEALKSDRQGICLKMYRDPRITGVGRIIRKLSIDELPQLFNVLMGDMVLIGPRPALPKEVAQYPQTTMARMNVMPGLTGLWQVSGRADTTFEEQVCLDLRYVEQASLWLDLKILWLTVPAVLLGRGAY